MITLKRAYTEAEAATYISMSRSYLRQARMTGNLQNRTPAPKHKKYGRKSVRYMIEELDRWLDQWHSEPLQQSGDYS